MKNNKKIIVALVIATATTTIFPTAHAAEEIKEPEAAIIETNEEATSETNHEAIDYSADNVFNFQDDEVTFPKNEANVREADGTNKFNRATETERDSFGEDQNVDNIDPEVAKN